MVTRLQALELYQRMLEDYAAEPNVRAAPVEEKPPVMSRKARQLTKAYSILVAQPKISIRGLAAKAGISRYRAKVIKTDYYAGKIDISHLPKRRFHPPEVYATLEAAKNTIGNLTTRNVQKFVKAKHGADYRISTKFIAGELRKDFVWKRKKPSQTKKDKKNPMEKEQKYFSIKIASYLNRPDLYKLVWCDATHFQFHSKAKFGWARKGEDIFLPNNNAKISELATMMVVSSFDEVIARMIYMGINTWKEVVFFFCKVFEKLEEDLDGRILVVVIDGASYFKTMKNYFKSKKVAKIVFVTNYAHNPTQMYQESINLSLKENYFWLPDSDLE